VTVENDANAAAWAEWRFGRARARRTWSASRSDRHRRSPGDQRCGAPGPFGIAGEFGHMQVVPGGHRCECGNRAAGSSTPAATRWSARRGSWPAPTRRSSTTCSRLPTATRSGSPAPR
jgi:predicted NBD/HSP70 family sugar kinase